MGTEGSPQSRLRPRKALEEICVKTLRGTTFQNPAWTSFHQQPIDQLQFFACSPVRNMRFATSLLILAGSARSGPFYGMYGHGFPTRGLEVIGVTSAQVKLESSSGVSGTLYIEQWPSLIGGVGAHIRIHGRVAGLETGLHGFHVHAVGNTSDNCLAAGGTSTPIKSSTEPGVEFTQQTPF